MQRYIIQNAKRAKLNDVPEDFTKRILDTIAPPMNKRWYEWLLHNLGNIIAMTSVLAFLGYVFLAVEQGNFQMEKSTSPTPFSDFSKIIQDGSSQLTNLLISKFSLTGSDKSDTHIVIFIILALGLLAFIDRIAQHILRKQRV